MKIFKKTSLVWDKYFLHLLEERICYIVTTLHLGKGYHLLRSSYMTLCYLSMATLTPPPQLQLFKLLFLDRMQGKLSGKNVNLLEPVSLYPGRRCPRYCLNKDFSGQK